jgi:hypothetical protein
MKNMAGAEIDQGYKTPLELVIMKACFCRNVKRDRLIGVDVAQIKVD